MRVHADCGIFPRSLYKLLFLFTVSDYGAGKLHYIPGIKRLSSNF